MRRELMFEVTEEAANRIKEYLKGQKDPKPIRVLVTEGGYRGAYLVMAQDNRKENDEVFTDRGVTYIVEKELFERAKPIRIDYVKSIFGGGYILDSQLLKELDGVFTGCRNICDTCGDSDY